MDYTILIPARLASTRLPNKPLADLGGVPMVVRVAQRVRSGLSPRTRIVVAADSMFIVNACTAHGIEAILTRDDHASGSDRLAEACETLELHDNETVINVQGDEPLIDPALVQQVGQLLHVNPVASMGTAAHPISQIDDLSNPNVVKVVLDKSQLALYFSRAPIAWWRDGFANGASTLPDPAPLRHIGIYAYRVGFLRGFPALAQSPIEVTEGLEQLRALWHGFRIVVHITPNAPGPGVDTPEDLERVRKLFFQSSNRAVN
jgi:3-deoxy-manno-octulosonate cytidylyltransferase (CMP-KDO synthetase)